MDKNLYNGSGVEFSNIQFDEKYPSCAIIHPIIKSYRVGSGMEYSR